jgi:alpha/beta superfamily hydrolase
MDFFPQKEQTFLLPGPSGDLEVLTSQHNEDVPAVPIIAIISHPHPLYGGTMNNKVVSTLARAFANLGIASVRFNFRGVGKSAGSFAEGEGELDDLLAIVDWVKTTKPDHKIWLAGFSFGAGVSAYAATKISPEQLVTIAPPVPRFGLLTLPTVACPWLIVQGEEDDVVIPTDVYAWAETRNPAPKLIRVPGAGHFFHGKLMELRLLLETALRGAIT